MKKPVMKTTFSAKLRKKIPSKEREQMLHGAIAKLISKNNHLYGFLWDVQQAAENEGMSNISNMIRSSKYWEEIQKYDPD